MKTWKLISGIINCVLFLVVSFQSCAAGVVNSVEKSSDKGGAAGMFLAFILLICGIISICTKNSEKNGGNITIMIMYILGAFLGFGNAAVYKDLTLWSSWALVCAVMSFIAYRKNKKA